MSDILTNILNVLFMIQIMFQNINEEKVLVSLIKITFIKLHIYYLLYHYLPV